MWTLVLGVTFGLLASTRSAEEVQVNFRDCSYARVFTAEGAQRHSLNLSMAEKVCQKLDSVLASPDQVKEAYEKGMETCRNGWMNNRSAAILRQSHHFNCAKNMTGFIVLSYVKPEDQYDVYCYDEQAAPEIDCNKTFRVRNISSDNTTLTTPLPIDNKMELERESEPISDTQTEEIPDNDHGRSTPSPDNNITRQGFTFTSTVDSSKDFEGSGSVEEGQPEGTTTATDSTHIYHTKTEQESGKTVSESPQSTNDKELEPTIVASDNQHLNSSSSNWLIILVVLVAIAAILVVCALIVYRKSLFGKRKTLIITKESNEGNGAAAASSSKTQEREQEMVTLMNKEKIQENGNTEEFTVITLEESPDKEQLA